LTLLYLNAANKDKLFPFMFLAAYVKHSSTLYNTDILLLSNGTILKNEQVYSMCSIIIIYSIMITLSGQIIYSYSNMAASLLISCHKSIYSNDADTLLLLFHFFTDNFHGMQHTVANIHGQSQRESDLM